MRTNAVIFCAGATIIAIPSGDKNGKRFLAMSELIEKTSHRKSAIRNRFENKSDNFEDI